MRGSCALTMGGPDDAPAALFACDKKASQKAWLGEAIEKVKLVHMCLCMGNNPRPAGRRVTVTRALSSPRVWAWSSCPSCLPWGPPMNEGTQQGGVCQAATAWKVQAHAVSAWAGQMMAHAEQSMSLQHALPSCPSLGLFHSLNQRSMTC